MAKKIGIISDTHGLLRPEVLEILRTCDCILHGGDINKPEILDQIRPLPYESYLSGTNAAISLSILCPLCIFSSSLYKHIF